VSPGASGPDIKVRWKTLLLLLLTLGDAIGSVHVVCIRLAYAMPMDTCSAMPNRQL
jgi:hypothetical protein